MRVRWTTNAAADLSQIVERIRAESPDAALHVARTIYNAIADLEKFPKRGRIGC
jgi:plasmid stabilization system protein ParE